MRRWIVNLNWVSLGVVLAALAASPVVTAQSAGGLPQTATSQGVAVPTAISVVNKPIFAVPKGGGLVISTGGASTENRVKVGGVTQFRLVLPHGVKGGKLSVVRRGVVGEPEPGDWKLGQWQTVRLIDGGDLVLSIVWRPRRHGPVLSPPILRAAEIRVNGTHGSLQITPGTALAGGVGAGGGARRYLQQMALDVRLKNGRKKRIEFLPVAPENRVVKLDPSVASAVVIGVPVGITAVGWQRRLSLAVAECQAKGGGGFHTVGGAANSGVSAVWMNLRSQPAIANAPAKGKLCQLRFGLVDGRLENNYAHETGLAASYIQRCQNALRLLARERKAGVYAITVQMRRTKKLLAVVESRYKRLKSVRKIVLLVELYPGGPVVETVTYRKAGPKPANRKSLPAPQPAQKKRPPAGF